LCERCMWKEGKGDHEEGKHTAPDHEVLQSAEGLRVSRHWV
jgi:hypothetical protein